MSSSIIEYSYQDTSVFFQSNAFINANSIAAKFNKKPETYLKTKRTKEYIEALRKVLFPDALKSATEQNQLFTVVKGGKAEEQGTWLHPKLAIDFARWLNPDFAVWCDMQIEKLLHPPRNAIVELQTLTPAQKNHIQNEVKHLVNNQIGTTYSGMWRSIKNQFKVGTYKEIPAAKYTELCEFLKCEPIEGELMPLENTLTDEMAIEKLRGNGYLVAPANKGGIKTLLIDWVPMPLFCDLVDLVAWRVRATNISVE